jgi:tRNA A-37 threonylcarbamoyl transferase component Bud32
MRTESNRPDMSTVDRFATLPKQIGHYKIGRQLGEGQDSTVYLTRDTVLDRQAAVKVLKQAGALGYERVLQEARLASSLDHPYICRVYDVGNDNGNEDTPPYIAMEYIEGTSLADKLEGGPLDSYTLLRLGMQVCEALAYAHDRRVIHGDVNATNVLINEECEAKLVDFGSAAGFHAGSAATIQGDIWALGNLLFQMASGDDAMARMQPRSAGELGLSELVSPGLAAIIERCVDTRLARCYHAASEVLRDLQTESDAMGGVGHGSPHASAVKPGSLETEVRSRTPRPSGWKNNVRLGRFGLVAAGALAVLVILLLTAQISRSPSPSEIRASESGRTESFGPNPRQRIVSGKKGNPQLKVWVNNRAMKYHCPDSPWYGRTLTGYYLTQKQALDQGYAPAYGMECP